MLMEHTAARNEGDVRGDGPAGVHGFEGGGGVPELAFGASPLGAGGGVWETPQRAAASMTRGRDRSAPALALYCSPYAVEDTLSEVNPTREGCPAGPLPRREDEAQPRYGPVGDDTRDGATPAKLAVL